MIRKATNEDYIHIVRAIQNKHISYITTAHVKQDIYDGKMFVMIVNEKIVAILSLTYDKDYNYYAMKRLCILNKKNCGKGYAREMLAYVSKQTTKKVGCTPWIDNGAMRHILEGIGFKLEYIFNTCWCFYSKNSAS